MKYLPRARTEDGSRVFFLVTSLQRSISASRLKQDEALMSRHNSNGMSRSKIATRRFILCVVVVSYICTDFSYQRHAPLVTQEGTAEVGSGSSQ